MKSNVKIDLSQPGRGLVFIDGLELHGVMSIDVRCRPGELTKVELVLAPDTVEVTGLAEVATRHAKLG